VVIQIMKQPRVSQVDFGLKCHFIPLLAFGHADVLLGPKNPWPKKGVRPVTGMGVAGSVIRIEGNLVHTVDQSYPISESTT
jgi:hypothetical protein